MAAFINKKGEVFKNSITPYVNKFIDGGDAKGLLRGEIDVEISNMMNRLIQAKK